MIERYRKRGRVVRFERNLRITIEEAGEAFENGELFSARPLSEKVSLAEHDGDLLAVVDAIRAIVRPPVEIERLIVTAGIADHEFGDARWRERTARVHLALVSRMRRLRSTLDLGAESIAGIVMDDVRVVADALARAGDPMQPRQPMIVAPHVTAAMLHWLFRVDGVALFQSAGGTDGKGSPIEERNIDGPVFPNWFRPSYRIRPVLMPFNLRAAATTAAIEADAPRVVAVLDKDARRFRVLCDDTSRVFETTVEIDHVRSVGPPAGWYPYSAGAFGSEMLL